MPDLSDVENELIYQVSAAVYPNGITQPSVANTDIKVYRGWPNSRALDADLLAGIVNVSVFPQAGVTRNVTASINRAISRASGNPNLMAWTIVEQTATLSGMPVVDVIVALVVDSVTYTTAVLPADTLGIIATRLSTLIPGASSSGPSVLLSYEAAIVGKFANVVTMFKERRRQSQSFQISCWCPDPIIRDAVAGAIDIFLADRKRLIVDGYGCQLIYRDTTTFDVSENANLYRRDLIYNIIYASTVEFQAMQMISASLGLEEIPFNAIPGTTP